MPSIGNLGADPVIIGQELFSSQATPAHQLGALATDGLGRYFRYAKAGSGAALVAGNVIQAAAEISAHYDCATAAASVGDYTVTVTPGATAGAANLYAGGLLVVNTTPGEGYSYPIVSHPAITASVAFVVTLGLPIQVALTTASRVTLTPNEFSAVIQAPISTLTGAVVGVAVYPIAASEYGWLGRSGTHATLVKGTPGPGVAVVSPGSAAGAVVVDGAAAATQVVGSMRVTGADGKLLPVIWELS